MDQAPPMQGRLPQHGEERQWKEPEKQQMKCAQEKQSMLFERNVHRGRDRDHDHGPGLRQREKEPWSAADG